MKSFFLFSCCVSTMLSVCHSQSVEVTRTPSAALICLNGEIFNTLKLGPEHERNMVVAAMNGFVTTGILAKDILSSGQTSYDLKLKPVQPLPSNYSSKKLEFGKLVDIEGELSKSALYYGYGIAQVLNAEGSRYKTSIMDKLESWGFNVVGSKNRLFEEKSEKSDLMLAGEIIKFEKGTKKTTGFRIAVMVEWSLFDNKKHKVVYSIKTTGFSDSGKPSPISDEFDLALGDALIGLITDKGFIEAAKKGDSDEEEKEEEMTETLISAAKPTNYDNYATMIKAVVGSVVTVVLEDGSHGSGFLVSEDGLILTNNHVVDGADNIEVIFSSGMKLPAKKMKVNEKRDIALIKAVGSGYTPFRINDDPESASLATEVIAIGTPADIELGQTVTKGIVSGVRKMDDQKFIQTDVSINPGNSGGPLLNKQGEVIGVIVSKISADKIEGLGFAIPIGEALKVLNIVVKE